MKDRELCPHALALRSISSTHVPYDFSWSEFLGTVCAARKKRFEWMPALSRGPQKRLQEWFRETPLLHEWVLSDRCLVSPKKWPNGVYAAFKHRMIPSPYEIANVNMHQKYVTNIRDFTNFFVVLMYCMGFTLEEISTAYNMSESSVVHAMHDSLSILNQLPQYLIWATATNFDEALWFAGWNYYGLAKKTEVLRLLNKNPFLLSDTDARLMVESSAYLAYLVYQSPKRPRLVKSCRLYRTCEELDGK